MKKLTLVIALAAGLSVLSSSAMAETYETIKRQCYKYSSDVSLDDCIDQKVSFAFKDLEGQLKMLKLKQQLNVGKDAFKTEVLLLKTEAKEKLENGESSDIVLGELILKLNNIIELY